MKRLLLFLFATANLLGSYAQDNILTFQPKDAGKPIDSLTVTNQNTGQKVKLLANESIALSNPTGITFFPSYSEGGYLYPNPSPGKATLGFSTLVNQEVQVSLTEVSGRLITRVNVTLAPGNHRIKVVFPARGLYTISVLKKEDSFAMKAISAESTVREGSLEYVGSESRELLKNAATGKTIKYTPGDVLLFSVFSGKSNTLFTDSPTGAKTYSVEFPESVDPENKSYKVVKIGTQWWFAENLQTTRYKDGTAIPQVTNPADWSALTTGAYVWYNNDASANRNLYGGYYNWEAVNSGKLCPAGWHVPTDAEWKTMEMAIGMTQAQADLIGQRPNGYGTKMKTGTGLDGFGFVFNSSGFSGLQGGYRLADGTYNYIGNAGYWWCATEVSATKSWFRALYNSGSFIGRADVAKVSGMNVRCVRD